MRSILVYEHLSAGGLRGDDADVLLPMGVAMRDTLLADLAQLPELRLTCAASEAAPAPAGVHALAVPGGEPAVAFVQRAARTQDLTWVIAPESDGVLAQMHEAVGSLRWIGCTAAAICIASSKRATLQALAARGVSTPLAFAAGHQGAWVVKPDDGAGAMHMRLYADQAAALAEQRVRNRRGQPATVEPWIEGEALSISMLAAPGFVQPVAFNRQTIAVDADGRIEWLGVEPNALDMRSDLRAVLLHVTALDVARALPGLRGFVGIDLVWHAERGPVIIEVNPRLTCAYVGLSAALQRNLAAEVLRLHDLGDAHHA